MTKNKKPACPHDHKNAIQVGSIDYMCPLCKNLIDPCEWFIMNSFNFVDEMPKSKKTSKIKICKKKTIK